MKKEKQNKERVEQLQAQLDCMNANYMALNKKYMATSIACHEACNIIKMLLDENDINNYLTEHAERLLERGFDE